MTRTRTLIIFLLIFQFSCSTKKAIHSDSAEDLYNQAMVELYEQEGGFPWVFTGTNYDKVLEILKEIQIRFAFSPFATLAEIRTADVYFRQGEYQQAVIEYESFIKRHPGHNEVEYATYQTGNSYYNLRKGKDRDPTPQLRSIEWFTRFIIEYPDSNLVDDARAKVAEARETLAEREIYIGKFYMRRKNYTAASERFNNVLINYSDTKHVDEATRQISRIPDSN